MEKVIEKGTKIVEEGWLETEETEQPFTTVAVTGLFKKSLGASNVHNIDGYLLKLNGYKVRLTIEVLDTSKNQIHL
jgi:hypothetical protein